MGRKWVFFFLSIYFPGWNFKGPWQRETRHCLSNYQRTELVLCRGSQLCKFKKNNLSYSFSLIYGKFFLSTDKAISLICYYLMKFTTNAMKLLKIFFHYCNLCQSFNFAIDWKVKFTNLTNLKFLKIRTLPIIIYKKQIFYLLKPY